MANVMNMIKRATLLLAILCGFSCSKITPIENESEWSEPSDGLSAKLVFSVADSDTHAKVIHPKLMLRNDSNAPIKFLKCVYHAGIFVVKHADGSDVERSTALSRSGGQGAEVIIIKPTESIEFDTYDYGYGLKPDKRIYAFNANSLQLELKPGKYIVNYSLDIDRAELKKIIKSYDWIKDDPNELWIGQISIRDVGMYLK